MAKPPEDTEIDARDDDSLPDVADLQMQSLVRSKIFGTPPAPVFVARFQLVRALGQGAMGAVFEAYDEQLRRRVALKILHKAGERSEEERNLRMLREAQTLAQLEHPNVVRVYEAGEHNGQVFMAMELVEGKTLHSLQTAKPLPSWQELLAVYIKAGRGLAAAHDKKVVHRDFKPHNVIIDADDEVKVLDFGLAVVSVEVDGHPTEELVPSPPGAIDRPPIDRLTASGQTPGTPVYMAPELFEGEPATARSDQFSFCVALYEALIGERPFFGKTIEELSAAIHEGELRGSEAQRGIPAWLLGALRRGLAARADDRFGSMAELLAELERDRTRWQRRAGAGAALAAVAIIAAGATWWFMGREDKPVVEAAARVSRTASCVQQTRARRDRWREDRKPIGHGALSPEGTEDLSAVVEAQALAYLARWGLSCIEDAGGEYDSCREDSSSAFDLAMADGSEEFQADAFFGLSESLAECLEGHAATGCSTPDEESPAESLLREATVANFQGLLQKAEDLGREALEAAGPLDELTVARIQSLLGAIAEKRGDLDEARRLLDAAFVGAMVCGDHVLALDVSLELVEVEALHSGDSAVAARQLASARLLLDRSEMKSLKLRKARFDEKQGVVLGDLEHDCEEGRPWLEQAEAARKRMLDDARSRGEPTQVLERLSARSRLNIANYELRAVQGDWSCATDLAPEDVVELYRVALAGFEAAVGDPKHRELAEYYFDLGTALLAADDPQEALLAFRSAQEIYELHEGSDSVGLADSHRAQVPIYLEQGDLKNAVEQAEASLKIWLSRRDDQGLGLAEAHDLVGVIAFENSRPVVAIKHHEAAVAVLDRKAAKASLNLNEREQLYLTLVNLANAQYSGPSPQAARGTIERGDHELTRLDVLEEGAFEEQLLGKLMKVRFLIDDGRFSEALTKINALEELWSVDLLKGHFEQERDRAKRKQRTY